MTESTQHSGVCLCGAVRLRVELAGASVGACHCGMCRKWTGGPLLAVESRGSVHIEGEENVERYQSSDWAERGFCRRCGTHLFYRLKSGNMHAVPVGVLDGDADWVLDHQIFIDEKPGFYAFANDTRNLTAAEVFAQYAPPN